MLQLTCESEFGGNTWYAEDREVCIGMGVGSTPSAAIEDLMWLRAWLDIEARRNTV